MPKKRNPENKGFPPRWRVLHGAIYYNVPKGLESKWDGKKLFRLGSNPSEAYRTWADKVELPKSRKKIGELIDRYLVEIVPQKAPATQRENKRYAEKLRPVFGDMYAEDFTPQDSYAYVDKRSAKRAAKLEMAFLSHVFTKAVRWGDLDSHPTKGEVRFDDVKEKESPKDRYVEDWELDEFHSLEPGRVGNDATLMLQAYAWIVEITGMSKGDILRIREKADCLEDGIHIGRHKTIERTGKITVYTWTQELRDAVTFAKSVRPVDISPWLFCNKRGKCYFNEEKGTASGFDSMWHRYMDRLIKETNLKERFTPHDIRAKAASDAVDDEHARKLMSHSNVAITRRVYRRKPEKVSPLK